MANSSVRAQTRVTRLALEDDSNFNIRPLKNRLQARFPAVKSSHLSEAIAGGLGFNTHAALLAAQSDPTSFVHIHLWSTARFRARMETLGYPIQADLSFGPPVAHPKPTAAYLERLQTLRELERSRGPNWARIDALREACAADFAKAFQLGHLSNKEDPSVVKRWEGSVDHATCMPGWGGLYNTQDGGLMDFPGSDHREKFYETLPLANGKSAEYMTAMVSMPYVGGDDQVDKLDEAAHLAGRIGWTCTVLNEWSWYAPGETALVLFKRRTPHAEILNAWGTSFVRWLLENKTLLKRNAGTTRRYAIDDTIHSPHVPLDVVDFADFRERFLMEFAYGLATGRDRGMLLVLQRLVEQWAATEK